MGGKEKKKKPLFQRAQCYQMDTCLLLFISKHHTGTHPLASLSPHEHSGALVHSCNNPNFHGALPYVYSTYASQDMPKLGLRGTFAAPEGSCPTSSRPAARLDPTLPHMPGKTKSIICSQGRAQQWGKS